jgi:hypothetical protein
MMSTNLNPCDLQTGAPELDPPDLAEHRILVRTFPKDAQERKCYQYLLQQMQGHPFTRLLRKSISRIGAGLDFT